MPRQFTCPRCLRAFTGDDSRKPAGCPTCGAAPPGMPMRDGMRARRDDDYEDEDEDLDDRPSRRGKRRSAERPGKIQAIAIMTLIGGIFACLVGLHWTVLWGVSTMGICCLWPGGYYSIVLGILAIIKGSQLLGKDARSLPPPKGIAIMMIINIVNGDIPNLAMGILILVFLSEPEIEHWYRG